MNKDEIAQRLAPLPKELVEKNIVSWDTVVLRYERFSENEYDEWIFPVFDLVKKKANTEQAKLFRAGTTLYSLMISTAEKHGLQDGEPFALVFTERNIKPSVSYWSGDTKVIEKTLNPEDDWLFVLQPLLDRLWNETRGKKNA